MAKLGRVGEAREELLRAASLTQNSREQVLLLERAAGLPPHNDVHSPTRRG